MKSWAASSMLFPVGIIQGEPVYRIHHPTEEPDESLSCYLNRTKQSLFRIFMEPTTTPQFITDKELDSADFNFSVIFRYSYHQAFHPYVKDAYRIVTVDSSILQLLDETDIHNTTLVDAAEIHILPEAFDEELAIRIQEVNVDSFLFIMINDANRDYARKFLFSAHNECWRGTSELFDMVDVNELERMYHGKEESR